jgi:hypothetical protein
MREYHYVVDREGRVFHDGTEIVDGATLRFFVRAMTRTDDGRWLVPCQGEQNWFDAADTPFVVQRLGLTLDAGRLVQVDLVFAGNTREPLDPGTLESDGGALCCRMKRTGFRARFGRVAMQQIAPYVVDDEGVAAVTVAGARHRVRAALAAGG